MEELEPIMEELIQKAKKRDTIAAILISSSFLTFGFLAIVLLDVFNLGDMKTPVVVFLLLTAWFVTMLGIYTLVSVPYPSLPSRVVADSSGVDGLAEASYDGKLYVPRGSYSKLPKTAALRMNIEVVAPDDEEVAKYRKYGDELAEAIAAAKMVRARYVISEKGNRKIEGIKIVKPSDFLKER